MTHEEELIKKMQEGDGAAAEELIRGYYPEILQYCLWHAPNRTAAEDAAQETFLKAIRYMDRYLHRGKFRAFLYKIAANVCADLWRSRENGELSLEECETKQLTEEAGFEEAASKLELLRLIRGLPREQREVVVLRFSQELTLREIAKATDTPLRTVQSRLRTALKRIKKLLEQEGTYER